MTKPTNEFSRRTLLAAGGGIAALAATSGVGKAVAAEPVRATGSVAGSSTTSTSDAIVDRYGQIIDVNWAGKITSDAQLRANVAKDARYYASLPSPKHLDRWGGEAGSGRRLGLRATGWFHVENHRGQSYLVDPDGNQFFSLGVDGLGYVGDTYTDTVGRTDAYAWLPTSDDDPLSAGWMESAHQNYSFYVANQIRKFGKYDWTVDWPRQVARTKAMGFNTAGSFSNRPAKSPLPYVTFVDNIPDHQIGSSGLYDAYAPGLQAELTASFTSTLAGSRDDPALIGYMFFSEIQWTNIRNGITQAQASQAATKGVLVDRLQQWYKSSVSAFNTAWGMQVTSFDDLRELSFSVSTNEAYADVLRFGAEYLDTFYGVFATAIRAADPHHMVIGDRWFGNVLDDQSMLTLLATACGKHLDALSYDYYTWNPSIERLGEIYRLSGYKPLIFTEFHYGETSHGLTFAIEMADSELQKGQFYRNYVENVAACGMAVGAHWFEYLDEAATGRWYQGTVGAESGAIGLIDVTDQPYKTMLGQVVKANDAIYALTNGKQRPYQATFSASQSPRTADQVMQVPRASTAPTIDGTLDSNWPTGPTLQLTSNNLVVGLANSELSGSFRWAWDDTNLYVHATVTDPTPMLNPNHGFDIWNGDAIEIFVGPKNVTQGGGMQANDTQIIISAQPQDASGTAEYYWYNARTDQPHIDAIVKPASGGYTIEAAIPLAGLYIDSVTTPEQLRFDFGLDDGNGTQRVSQFIWNGSASDSSTRDLWGTAWLVDAVSDTPPGQSGPSHPHITYSTLTVHPGDYIHVFGSSLNPGEQLAVQIDGTRLGTLTGDENGKADWWVRTPSNVRSGSHRIEVLQGTTSVSRASLIVRPYR
jgi:hypothetical protein